MPQISLAEKVGANYKKFWDCKQRYRICKGSRNSKKSYTTALWYICNMMKYVEEYDVYPNTLVVRQRFNSHADSTFATLKWAIHHLEVEHLWKCTINPLRMTYIPGGNSIMFKGMDSPDSVTSITVPKGQLCWLWVKQNCSHKISLIRWNPDYRQYRAKFIYR